VPEQLADHDEREERRQRRPGRPLRPFTLERKHAGGSLDGLDRQSTFHGENIFVSINFDRSVTSRIQPPNDCG
jgi:hypothetical protein